MKKTLVLMLSIVMFTNLSAQQSFTKQELLDDIDSLYVIINEIHPNMFAFISQEEFDMKVEKAKHLIKDDMTLSEFFNITAPLVADLKDGHTSIYFPYNILRRETKIFPILIKVQHPCFSTIVLDDYNESDISIPAGTIIKTINGKDVNKLAQRMYSTVSGEMDSFRFAIMNKRLPELIYALVPDSIFNIEYIVDGNILSATLPGTGFTATRKRMIEFEKLQQQQENYSLSVDHENKIATIHFNIFTDLPRFQTFVDSAFTVINNNGISDLIIDIRQNGGGQSSIGDEFFQYISHEPFQQFGKVQTNASERQNAYTMKHYGYDISPLGLSEFDIVDLRELRDNPLRFSGNVYLLTSNYSFSSAASFAWAFQYFNMGTIIGEETGGLIVCYGDIISQFLPNTNIQFGTSFKKFYMYGSTDEHMHGVIPDIKVPAAEAMDYAISNILKASSK